MTQEDRERIARLQANRAALTRLASQFEEEAGLNRPIAERRTLKRDACRRAADDRGARRGGTTAARGGRAWRVGEHGAGERTRAALRPRVYRRGGEVRWRGSRVHSGTLRNLCPRSPA